MLNINTNLDHFNWNILCRYFQDYVDNDIKEIEKLWSNIPLIYESSNEIFKNWHLLIFFSGANAQCTDGGRVSCYVALYMNNDINDKQSLCK